MSIIKISKIFAFFVILAAMILSIAPSLSSFQDIRIKEKIMEDIALADKLSAVHSKVKSKIDDGYYGGSYIDGDSIIINLVKRAYDKMAVKFEKIDGIDVYYKPVKYSIRDLSEITERIVPYMIKYNMASLGIDVRENKIKIEVYSLDNAIYDFVSGYIEKTGVDISVLPEGTVIKFTF